MVMFAMAVGTLEVAFVEFRTDHFPRGLCQRRGCGAKLNLLTRVSVMEFESGGAGVVATILAGASEIFEGSQFLPGVALGAGVLVLGVVVQRPVTVATQEIALEQFD